ncbi:hypothetical protein MBOE_42290 [Mycolicibacterium boenickei]|uniref:Uncharacterized protein n=1 Tax=Mycolicibacterium boenickei TaxID=146017 RepID=A0ABN5ZG81_9MYCO|nr:hypothetical protein MBOE_42290 [Mycolicibacterium boenickei]
MEGVSTSATDGVLAEDVAEEVSVSEPHAASAMVNDAAQATSATEEGTRKEFMIVTLQPHVDTVGGWAGRSMW